MKTGASRRQPLSWGVALSALGLIIVTLPKLDAQGQGRCGRGEAGPRYSLSDPAPQDPALRGVIDLHAHQDPDSNGPSDGQAARSLAAMYVEFTSRFGHPNATPETVREDVTAIRAAGVEHSFVSSDTGQLRSKFQPDALADAAKALRAQGFTERELDLLFKINPAKILGLPPPSEISRLIRKDAEPKED